MKTAKTVQHTPGPWRIVHYPEQNAFNGRRLTVSGRSGPICDCDWNSPQENAANAQLIAAAPELLEALQAVMQFEQRITSCKEDGGTRATTTARAAIAKALGQQ